MAAMTLVYSCSDRYLPDNTPEEELPDTSEEEDVVTTQNLLGMWAQTDKHQKSDSYIKFDNTFYRKYVSEDRHLAHDKTYWQTVSSDFTLTEEIPYTMEDNVLFLDGEELGRCRMGMSDDTLYISETKYLKVNKFSEERCPDYPYDLSYPSAANCYIVSSEGQYEFRTVKGNSTESVGKVASAEILWESFGSSNAPNRDYADLYLIEEVSASEDYITFTATRHKGNAVIAAKDAEGKILWSWHIWMTDQPEDQVYNNEAGVMMDRNLGATSVSFDNGPGFGLLYQWGRKDPFVGGIYRISDIIIGTTITWPAPVISNSTSGTIAYATEHPTTFITGGDDNGNWCYGSADNTLWQSEKTIYDPCPAGYRVPDGDVWSEAFGPDLHHQESESQTHALNFGSGEINVLTDTCSDCWYFGAGRRLAKDGSVSDTGEYGYYWSCTASQSDSGKAYSMSFYLKSFQSVNVTPEFARDRASGFSVRCVRE